MTPAELTEQREEREMLRRDFVGLSQRLRDALVASYPELSDHERRYGTIVHPHRQRGGFYIHQPGGVTFSPYEQAEKCVTEAEAGKKLVLTILAGVRNEAE